MKKSLFIIALAALTVSCSQDETQYDASGVFETTEVIVSAKAQGEIVELNVEEGQQVTQGTAVGVIDYKQLSIKKQQLESTRQSGEDRKLDVSSQVASIKQQITNAQKEKARFEKLYQENAASRKQVDDIQYQINVLEQQLAATVEQLNTSNASISSNSQSINNQISGVDVQIADATIASPITGTVLTKYAEAGEYAAPGRALFRVANIDDMKLRAYVTAEQVTTLKIGQKVTVYADEGKDGRKSYEGIVSWISSEAEFTPKTIQTRDERSNLIYAIKIDVQNTDQLIKIGMYADVRL